MLLHTATEYLCPFILVMTPIMLTGSEILGSEVAFADRGPQYRLRFMRGVWCGWGFSPHQSVQSTPNPTSATAP